MKDSAQRDNRAAWEPEVREQMLAAEGRFEMSIPLNVLGAVRTVGDLAQQLHHLIERR